MPGESCAWEFASHPNHLYRRALYCCIMTKFLEFLRAIDCVVVTERPCATCRLQVQLWLFQFVSRPLLQAPDKLQGYASSYRGLPCHIYCAVALLGLSSDPRVYMSIYDAGQDRQHFMLTTMDTLDSVGLAHASPAKGGDAEETESLPAPVPAEQGHVTSTFLLASLPSRLGALWTSAEPGKLAKYKALSPPEESP